MLWLEQQITETTLLDNTMTTVVRGNVILDSFQKSSRTLQNLFEMDEQMEISGISLCSGFKDVDLIFYYWCYLTEKIKVWDYILALPICWELDVKNV